jgi:hypothetical protein
VRRADTHTTIGSTKGIPSRISPKNSSSTVPHFFQASTIPGVPGERLTVGWGLSILHGASAAGSLSPWPMRGRERPS